MHWGVHFLRRSFSVMKLIAISKLTYDRFATSWNSSPMPFGVSEHDASKNELIFRAVTSCVYGKQNKKKMRAINASDQCEREPKCTREWKVTGQTSSAADAVPLLRVAISILQCAHRVTDNLKSWSKRPKLQWIFVINWRNVSIIKKSL